MSFITKVVKREVPTSFVVCDRSGDEEETRGGIAPKGWASITVDGGTYMLCPKCVRRAIDPPVRAVA